MGKNVRLRTWSLLVKREGERERERGGGETEREREREREREMITPRTKNQSAVAQSKYGHVISDQGVPTSWTTSSMSFRDW